MTVYWTSLVNEVSSRLNSVMSTKQITKKSCKESRSTKIYKHQELLRVVEPVIQDAKDKLKQLGTYDGDLDILQLKLLGQSLLLPHFSFTRISPVDDSSSEEDTATTEQEPTLHDCTSTTRYPKRSRANVDRYCNKQQ